MILYHEQNLCPPPFFRLRIEKETDSTNTHLFRLAEDGEASGLVLLARRQSAGKGSRGRSFFSPEGGLYFSILLRNLPPHRLSLLTPLTAVAVYRALRPHTNKDLAIKWVNDLYLEGKKVCGILTENRFTGTESTTVVGVGINLLPPINGFPTDFFHPAAALLRTPDTAAAEDILNTFFKEFDLLLKTGNCLEEYRAHCCTLGKEVVLCTGKETITGKAVAILDDGALLLRFADGREQAFSAGEVTSQHKTQENGESI